MEFHGSVFLLQLVTFVLGLGIAWKIFIPVIRGWMQEREERIARAFQESREKLEQAEKLKRDLEVRLREAELRAKELLEGARKEAEQMKEKIVQDARSETERLLAAAKARIAGEEEALRRRVMQETAEWVSQTTARVIQRALTPEVRQKLIAESLEEVSRN